MIKRKKFQFQYSQIDFKYNSNHFFFYNFRNSKLSHLYLLIKKGVATVHLIIMKFGGRKSIAIKWGRCHKILMSAFSEYYLFHLEGNGKMKNYNPIYFRVQVNVRIFEIENLCLNFLLVL